MAIPTLSGGITNAENTLSNADSTAGWSGNFIGTDLDIKVEGTAAVLCTLRTDLSTIQYTNGTGVNMSTQHFRGWINTITIGQLDFMEAYLGSAFYRVFKGPVTTTNPAGIPTYRGGYQYVVVYGGNTPDSGAAPGTVTAFGFRFNRVSSPQNKTNTYVDVFRYGDGYTATGGTLADPINFIGIADVDVVDAYGIVQNIRDTSFLFGEVTIGSGATATYMSVANEAVIFADIPVSSTLYKITATGSGCTFDATNSLFKANGAQNFLFDMSAVGSLICEGNVFIQASPLVFGSGQSVTSNTFINCGGTTTNGATIARGAFENCDAVVVSDLSQLSLCTFMRDDAQTVHAVELTSLGTGTMTWTCTADDGYAAGTADTFTPANDAGLDASIFVNVASGNLTISVGAGGTIPSIRTAGATVTVQQAVTLSITNVIEGSEVRIYDTSLNELGGGVEQVGISTPGSGFTVTAEGGGRYTVEYSYNYSADQDVIIVIFDVDYLPLRLEDVLGSTSRSIKVEQVFDRNYDEGATPLVNP
jgi:hypothetical protein